MVSQKIFVWMETSWRRLKDVFRLCLQKTSSKRIQDILIKTNIFALVIPFQKMSSRPLRDILLNNTNIFVLAIRLQGVFKTFSRRIQDVFKTSSRRLSKTSSSHLQDVFKTFFNTSSRRVAKISSRCFQDVSSS